MVGVWMAPVTAQVMITFLWGAAMLDPCGWWGSWGARRFGAIRAAAGPLACRARMWGEIIASSRVNCSTVALPCCSEHPPRERPRTRNLHRPPVACRCARRRAVSRAIAWSGHRHAETLIAELETLLSEAGLGVADLDAVAFGAGPGAFTGLRIAAGVAQGIAASRGLPVIGVNCLEAIAHASGAPRALVCIDARMGEVYYAAYLRDAAGGMTAALAPGVGAPGAVPLPEDAGLDGLRQRVRGPSRASSPRTSGRECPVSGPISCRPPPPCSISRCRASRRVRVPTPRKPCRSTCASASR